MEYFPQQYIGMSQYFSNLKKKVRAQVRASISSCRFGHSELQLRKTHGIFPRELFVKTGPVGKVDWSINTNGRTAAFSSSLCK